ncbi:MAG: cytochrome b [Thiolinea sp.]
MYNTHQQFGWVSILLHWVMAVILIGLYFVGDYMVELTYYDPLYHTLPAWHKAFGVLMGFALLFRLVWVYAQPRPHPYSESPLELNLAKLGHLSLYGLLVVMIISGYLISTAKGKGIEIFGLFEMPALLGADEERGELAGKVHEFAGNAFILLVGVHALAALFHHFYRKDSTLTRMLGFQSN